MARSCKIIAMVEPALDQHLRSLATKKGMSTSALIRSLIIDELRAQGMMPEEYMSHILKGTPMHFSNGELA